MNKPDWWPQNPYPADIFIGDRSELPTLIPDGTLRTHLSGIMGRLFWDIASDTIFDRWQQYRDSAPVAAERARVLAEVREIVSAADCAARDAAVNLATDIQLRKLARRVRRT